MKMRKKLRSFASSIDSGVGKVAEAKKDFERSNTGKAFSSWAKKQKKRKRSDSIFDLDI